MRYPHNEEESIKIATKDIGEDYNRLLSFYYKDPWAVNVLNLLRRIKDEKV
jgi:predicted P-loop ATPase/GTPase